MKEDDGSNIISMFDTERSLGCGNVLLSIPYPLRLVRWLNNNDKIKLHMS